MGGLFGKHKKRRVTEQDEVVIQLKQLRDTLKQSQQETKFNLEVDLLEAKQLLRAGRREEAKAVLMKKRYHEKVLRSSNTQLDKIEYLTQELELAQVEIELAKLGENKVKRNKWKLALKKNRKRSQNPDAQAALRQPAQDIEIQVPDGFKKKEKEKIIASTRDGIKKQRKIDKLITGESNFELNDKAVEAELEAILDAKYPVPDMRQEKFSYIEECP